MCSVQATGLSAERWNGCVLPCSSPVSVLAASQLWLFRAICDSPSKAGHGCFVVVTFFTRVLATCPTQWAEKWRGSWALDSAQRTSMTGQGLTVTGTHTCDSHYNGKYPEEVEKMSWGPVVTSYITFLVGLKHGLSCHYFGPVRGILSGRCWLFPNIC